MTDVAQSEIHPDTLAMLKGSMPKIRWLLAQDDAQPDQAKLQAATDETRQNFPGLDDLTLAAFMAYDTLTLMRMAKDSEDPFPIVQLAMACAEVANALAWSLDIPEQS